MVLQTHSPRSLVEPLLAGRQPAGTGEVQHIRRQARILLEPASDIAKVLHYRTLEVLQSLAWEPASVIDAHDQCPVVPTGQPFFLTMEHMETSRVFLHGYCTSLLLLQPASLSEVTAVTRKLVVEAHAAAAGTPVVAAEATVAWQRGSDSGSYWL